MWGWAGSVHVWSAVVPAAHAEEPAAEETEDVEEEEEVEVVVVTGTRSEHAQGDSPVATEVIDAETIARSGATSAADLLERVAGVQTTRSAFGASVALQGLDPTHTLVIVDGQRMIGRKDGVLDLSRISADRIERIEIVKGPGSTLYGSDAMAGVIHIITKRPDAPRFTGDVRYGGFRTFDGSGSYETRGDVVGSVSTLGLHWQDPYDLDPTDAAEDGVGLDQADVSQKLRFDLSPGFDLEASASYLTRGTRAREEQAAGASFDRINRVEEATAQLSETILAGTNKLAISQYVTVFRDQFFYDQRGSNREDQYEDNRQTLGELDVAWTSVVKTHTVTVGSEGFAEYNVSPRLSVPSAERYRGAVYAQDEWSIVPKKVELLPGARFDVDSQFGSAPTPRLAAAWFANEDLVVRGNYGLGFRAPSFKELYLLFENPAAGYVIVGNPDLLPERSRGGTLGLEADPGKWNLAVQGFRNDVQDLIIIAPDESGGFSATQRFVQANVAQAYTMGVDASASVRLARDALTLRLGGQLLRTLGNVVEPDVFVPLPGRPPGSATGGVYLKVPHSGLSVTSDATWTANRPFYEERNDDGQFVPADDTVKSPQLVLLDARAAWDLRDGTQFYVGGENLLDQGDAQYSQFKPRWVYAGFRLSVDGK
jgi:outer membrane receptor for ferrienterochelin and colicins